MGRDSFFGDNAFGQEQWARRGEAATAAATAVSGALPVGVINAYYGTTAPSGWLLCDGAAIPAIYVTLIALVGANTPNLKGRVIVGRDAAQTEFDTLGETGGAKTLTIASGNLPVHTHGLNGHNHGGGTNGTDAHSHTVGSHNHGGGTGVHAHSMGGQVATNVAHGHGGSGGQFAGEPNAGGFFGTNPMSTNSVGVGNTFETPGTTSESTHAHGVANDFTSTANGGFANTAVDKLPPYIAISYIIKAL